jgi:hypothetical protein
MGRRSASGSQAHVPTLAPPLWQAGISGSLTPKRWSSNVVVTVNALQDRSHGGSCSATVRRMTRPEQLFKRLQTLDFRYRESHRLRQVSSVRGNRPDYFNASS